MTRRRRTRSAVAAALSRLRAGRAGLWLAGGVLLVLIAAVWLLSVDDEIAEQDKPRVAYMSSLPLAFGEADMAATVQGESSADPFYLRLAEHYRMEAVDDLEKVGEMAPDALLLIQPRAFSPHENVALDRWVRAGGELLFLVDPALTRESRFPLGDKRRPLFTSMASPVLGHWGLELTLPMDEASPRVVRTGDGGSFETRAPGAFRLAEGRGGVADCDLTEDGFVARCAIGEGVAILIADADFVDPEIWRESGLFGDDDGGVQLVLSYLEELAASEQ